MDLYQLAQRQLDDYDRHQPGTLFAGYPIPMTVEEAYQLQHAVADLRQQRGEAVAGYKIGCISPVMQAQLGLQSPVFGRVFETELKPTGATLNTEDYAGLAIEGEFAIRIATDIPDSTWLRHHPLDAICAAFPVIELHNYVFRNIPHNAQELIANNAIHAGAVLPRSESPLTDPSLLLDATIQVALNGVALGTATGRALPEGPFGGLVRLAEHLARFGQTLRHGQLVLTGSPLPLYRVNPGDRIEVTSDTSEPTTVRISLNG
ncbi:MAG: fumarylacetoacetate hydrolase family protein [Bryobacteraceae bacterium]